MFALIRGCGFYLRGVIAVMAAAAFAAVPSPADDDKVVELDGFTVEAAPVEIEVWPEEEADMFPFGRNPFFRIVTMEQGEWMEESSTLEEQIAAMVEFNPGEFATVSGAAAPRGFTTPRLRNGINQSGFPEILGRGTLERLTGFLATYYGRTAPGGILNTVTRPPARRPGGRLDIQASTNDSVRVAYERSAPLVPGRLSWKLATEGRVANGPADHAGTRSFTGSAAFRYAPSKDTTWRFELESGGVRSHPSGGIPLARTEAGEKVGSPYLPLSRFNTNGPNARAERLSASMSVLVDHELTGSMRLRAAAQVWERRQWDHRFSTGPYRIDTGFFDGVREPQFNERTQQASGVQVELDGRGSLPTGDHRWVIGAFVSREDSERENRGLPRETRDELPEGVRRLDPLNPDYSLTPFSPEIYSRILTLRRESASYTGVFVTERMSLAGDRLFATGGIRGDWIGAEVNDLRLNANVPRATASVDRTTYHMGLVAHILPNRLAGFVNHSTAFQPARRVDARTGNIQGNEGTRGFEAGLRHVVGENRLVSVFTIYRLWNENITRNNPFYEDPVFDPDRRQPQLVSSGEERFTGAEVSTRFMPSHTTTVFARYAWLDAVTTKSPDLPEEVGRQLRRLPRQSASASLRRRFTEGRLDGFSVGVSGSWIGRHVAVYETNRLAEVGYGSYAMIGCNLGYQWGTPGNRRTTTLSASNALDKDLAAAAGRVGGERAVQLRYSYLY